MAGYRGRFPPREGVQRLPRFLRRRSVHGEREPRLPGRGPEQLHRNADRAPDGRLDHRRFALGGRLWRDRRRHRPANLTDGRAAPGHSHPGRLPVGVRDQQREPPGLSGRGHHAAHRLSARSGSRRAGDRRQFPAADPTKTTRERFESHAADAGCASCHKSIDSFGFPLEEFDGMGKLRTTDNGKPVDSQVTISVGSDIDGTYADGVALANALAASPTVKTCLAGRCSAASPVAATEAFRAPRTISSKRGSSFPRTTRTGWRTCSSPGSAVPDSYKGGRREPAARETRPPQPFPPVVPQGGRGRGDCPAVLPPTRGLIRAGGG